MKPQSYFNTTGVEQPQLGVFINDALKQEDAVMAFFDQPNNGYTPSMIHAVWPVDNTPLTSVRRAMTQLTRKGRLVKTDIKVDGMYKRPEHVWRKAA